MRGSRLARGEVTQVRGLSGEMFEVCLEMVLGLPDERFKTC